MQRLRTSGHEVVSVAPEQTMKRPSALVPIIAGFSLMLLLLLSVTAIGFTHIRNIGQQLTAMASERNQKSELAASMRGLHELRHLSLLLAAGTTDPFARDEEIMHFRVLAGEFVQLRDRFLVLSLDGKERAIWDRVRDNVRQVEAVSEQALDLLQLDHSAQARALIQQELAPRQAQMMEEWQQLVVMQHSLDRKALEEAVELRQRALNLTLGLSAIVIGIGAIVAVFVVRLSRRLEMALLDEKELAQVTLGGIADAVIRFDARRNVMFMNQAAERMLGLTAAETCDRPLTEVVNLYDRPQASEITEDVIGQVTIGETYSLPLNCYLRTEHGNEREIEGQCSPLHNLEGAFVGGVLVMRDVGEARAMQRKLAWQADHDDLTGLHTRRVFEQRLNRILSSRRIGDYPLSLLHIDLCQFRSVNNQAGHQAGDELLRQLGRIMCERLRQTDLLSRLGGDEFGAILVTCPDEAAERIAENMRDAISAHRFVWHGQSYQAGASIGIVHIPQHWDNIDTCLAAAQAACDRAKELGRDQVVVHRA